MKRILVFDDDKSIIGIMKFILEAKGWEVQCFTQCNDAVYQIRSHQPGIIMMDNNIPDHGGIFAIKTIKQQIDLMHIPIIYFTAHDNIKNLAKEAGADAYLAKPFDLDKLEELIETLSSPKPIGC
ncbi:response regulator [Daejeonella sp.]|uniref:response regulator n=1 Tax=Daejeonella sp. TaxID=2805397 RepID=UPI0030BBB055